jgi:hypothetical protein
VAWHPRFTDDVIEGETGELVEASPRRFQFDDDQALRIDMADATYAKHVQPLIDLLRKYGHLETAREATERVAARSTRAPAKDEDQERQVCPVQVGGCGAEYGTQRYLLKHVREAHAGDYAAIVRHLCPPWMLGVRCDYCQLILAGPSGKYHHEKACPLNPEVAAG